MTIFFRIIFLTLILLSLFLSLSPAQHSVPMIWNDKLVHCVSYFLLVMMLDFSWKPGEALLAKSLFIFVYSSLIEFGQSFVPGRDMSIEDIVANCLGVLLFIFIVPLFRRVNIYQTLRLI